MSLQNNSAPTENTTYLLIPTIKYSFNNHPNSDYLVQETMASHYMEKHDNKHENKTAKDSIRIWIWVLTNYAHSVSSSKTVPQRAHKKDSMDILECQTLPPDQGLPAI